jgi:hypothetical protein
MSPVTKTNSLSEDFVLKFKTILLSGILWLMFVFPCFGMMRIERDWGELSKNDAFLTIQMDSPILLWNVSPDGIMVVSFHRDGFVRVFDTEMQKFIHKINMCNKVPDILFFREDGGVAFVDDKKNLFYIESRLDNYDLRDEIVKKIQFSGFTLDGKMGIALGENEIVFYSFDQGCFKCFKRESFSNRLWDNPLKIKLVTEDFSHVVYLDDYASAEGEVKAFFGFDFSTGKGFPLLNLDDINKPIGLQNFITFFLGNYVKYAFFNLGFTANFIQFHPIGNMTNKPIKDLLLEGFFTYSDNAKSIVRFCERYACVMCGSGAIKILDCYKSKMINFLKTDQEFFSFPCLNFIGLALLKDGLFDTDRRCFFNKKVIVKVSRGVVFVRFFDKEIRLFKVPDKFIFKENSTSVFSEERKLMPQKIS